MTAFPAIEKLYALVPDAGCKGLCTDTCAVIIMSVHEARRLRRNGTPLPHHEIALAAVTTDPAYRCPALIGGRCSVYELRPLICRLYGAAEELECEHGCKPASGLLPSNVAHGLIDLVEAAGGGRR